MSVVRKDPLTRLFYLIAEPRVVRIFQLLIYLGYVWAGSLIWLAPSESLRTILGMVLLTVFGAFMVLGGLLGAFAVLPGIWWLERAGIVGIVTALLIYLVVILTLGVSGVGVVVALILTLCMVKRWIEIRKYQVAPSAAVP